MTTMTSATPGVTGGVDTHGQTHHAAALDHLGRQLGDQEFPTTPAAYRALLSWLSGHGSLERVGVEGTGTYGAALSRHLRAAGVQVLEVDRPDRKARRTRQVRPAGRLLRGPCRAGGCRYRGAQSPRWPDRGDPDAARRAQQRGQGPQPDHQPGQSPAGHRTR